MPTSTHDSHPLAAAFEVVFHQDLTAAAAVEADVEVEVEVAGTAVARLHHPTHGAHGLCRGPDLDLLFSPQEGPVTVRARRTRAADQGVLRLLGAEEVDVTAAAAAATATMTDGAVRAATATVEEEVEALQGIGDATVETCQHIVIQAGKQIYRKRYLEASAASRVSVTHLP